MPCLVRASIQLMYKAHSSLPDSWSPILLPAVSLAPSHLQQRPRAQPRVKSISMEPPPSPPGAGNVCCMCGDRGLPHELLRCKLCRVRLQHRYCSDLYPRATAYRRCNWCLREPAEGGGGQALARAVASKTTDKRKAAASAEEEVDSCRQSHEAAGCAATRSRRPAAEVGRPVKKHKVHDRAELPPSPGATARGNSGNKKLKAGERAALPPPSPGATGKGNNGSSKHKTDERAALPPSPGATGKGSNGSNKHKTDERAALPPSPGATGKGNNGSNKHKTDDRATLPSSPGATAKGNKQKVDDRVALPSSPGATAKGNKQKVDDRVALPPSPGATAKGNSGNKKPMQAGKLTRPGRVKVRRYRLLAEVISC